MMSAHAINLSLGFLARAVVLLVLIWAMARLLRVECHFPGLAASSGLTAGADLIPHYGHWVAAPVLVFWVWRTTRASLFPETLFVITPPFVAMLCLSLFVLPKFAGRPEQHPGAQESNARVTQPRQPTNEATGEAASPAPQPVASNLFRIGEGKPVQNRAGPLWISGITRNGAESSVTLQTGEKTYNISLGQTITVQTTNGPVPVQFSELGSNWLILTIAGNPVKRPAPH